VAIIPHAGSHTRQNVRFSVTDAVSVALPELLSALAIRSPLSTCPLDSNYTQIAGQGYVGKLVIQKTL
jgi:hypothetical protein